VRLQSLQFSVSLPVVLLISLAHVLVEELMLTVGLGKRQRQHSIPPLNLEELKEEKAAHFAAEVTNWFTALEAAQDKVTPTDLWKGTKTVLSCWK